MLGITIALHHLGHFKMCITAGEMQTLLLRRVPLAAISSTSGGPNPFPSPLHAQLLLHKLERTINVR